MRFDATFHSEDSPAVPNMVERVEILWSLDSAKYRVQIFHLQDGGTNYVTYDDGHVETINLSSETGRFFPPGSPTYHAFKSPYAAFGISQKIDSAFRILETSLFRHPDVRHRPAKRRQSRRP